MPCITTTSDIVCEEGTYKVSFLLTDENNSVATPTVLSWQLSDKSGNVINSRSFESNDILGTQEPITIGGITGNGYVVRLLGDDLAILNDYDDGERVFAIQALYDSTLGNDNKLKGELYFTITDLINF